MKKLLIWQGAGFIFTGIAGVILHFLYEWTNQSRFFSFFSAVNESTWEHMKLLFVPLIIFALIESRFLKEEYNCFWCVKLKGILVGLTLIPVLYYTYIGVFGVNADWFNIAIFYIAAAVSLLVEARAFLKGKKCRSSCLPAKVMLIFIALLFAVFTVSPPEIPLFQEIEEATFCNMPSRKG